MKVSIRKIAAASALLISTLIAAPSAMATDKGYLVLHTVALHFENFSERNTFTPGLGWEYSPSSKIGFHGGTLSDSFGYQSYYGGLNYASKPKFNGKVRFILGATILHKQYLKNGGPETKLVPLPIIEYKFTDQAVLNISGSPQIDYGNHRNNAVMFFQLKLALQ